MPFLFLLGGVGFALFNNIMYLALNYTSAINVGIVQGAMPLVVFLLNFALFRIKTNWMQMLGFTLTLIGVISTITRGDPLSLFTQSAQLWRSDYAELRFLPMVAIRLDCATSRKCIG